ncbi:hypothetical protein ACFLX7_01300 [Chloroflexota bacterium]
MRVIDLIAVYQRLRCNQGGIEGGKTGDALFGWRHSSLTTNPFTWILLDSESSSLIP